ncbi:MAG: S24 family peptidase [Methylibium sp.]
MDTIPVPPPNKETVAEGVPAWPPRPATDTGAVAPPTAELWWRVCADERAFAELRDRLRVELGARINSVRTAQGKSRADLSRWLRNHENTVAKIERGETLPDALQLLQLAQMLGQTLDQMLGTHSDDPADVPRKTTAVEIGHHLFVPHFDIQAAAGHGAFNDAERVKEMRAFAIDFFRRDLRISHNDLALIDVTGPSMEPQIHSGDVVLIDRRDTGVQVEGPHVVRFDGGLMVKLLQRRPGGLVRVTSINPLFDPFEIELGAEGTDFEVIGRVRWAGVTFR